MKRRKICELLNLMLAEKSKPFFRLREQRESKFSEDT
jgi:hypothetical protein